MRRPRGIALTVGSAFVAGLGYFQAGPATAASTDCRMPWASDPAFPLSER